jgi:DNA-directed RNA polymerase specialized sigma24 family protein
VRLIWQTIHADLSTSIGTLNAAKHFEIAKRERPELHRFTDPAAVLDFLHGREGHPEAKDRILVAFVEIMQSNGSGAEFAMTMLWLALWPALDAVYRRLSRHFRDAAEDLVSEMTEQFTLAVRRADMRRIHRIAATLVRNAERNIRTRLRQTWQERSRVVPLCDDESANERDGLTRSVFAGSPGLSPLGLPAGIDFDREADLIRKELWRLVGSHADMVVAVAIFDEPQNEIAERLGISEAAGRKRFQRALKQLRKEYGFA